MIEAAVFDIGGVLEVTSNDQSLCMVLSGVT